jgi:hypothetical protein
VSWVETEAEDAEEVERARLAVLGGESMEK